MKIIFSGPTLEQDHTFDPSEVRGIYFLTDSPGIYPRSDDTLDIPLIRGERLVVDPNDGPRATAPHFYPLKVTVIELADDDE